MGGTKVGDHLIDKSHVPIATVNPGISSGVHPTENGMIGIKQGMSTVKHVHTQGQERQSHKERASGFQRN